MTTPTMPPDPADLINTILGATPLDRDEAYLTAFADVLRDHHLTEIVCDHERRQDNPVCSCSRAHLGWHQSVGEAVEAWIAHVFRHMPRLGDPRPVAARQAAATLRWLADDLDAKADAINPNPLYRPSIHIDPAGLRELADQLDTHTTHTNSGQ